MNDSQLPYRNVSEVRCAHSTYQVFRAISKAKLGQLFHVLLNFDYASDRDRATANIQ